MFYVKKDWWLCDGCYDHVQDYTVTNDVVFFTLSDHFDHKAKAKAKQLMHLLNKVKGVNVTKLKIDVDKLLAIV